MRVVVGQPNDGFQQISDKTFVAVQDENEFRLGF